MGPGDKNVVFSVWQEINFNSVYLDGRYANMHVCLFISSLVTRNRCKQMAAKRSNQFGHSLYCTVQRKNRTAKG